jgi:hypothetical protein
MKASALIVACLAPLSLASFALAGRTHPPPASSNRPALVRQLWREQPVAPVRFHVCPTGYLWQKGCLKWNRPLSITQFSQCQQMGYACFPALPPLR